MLRNKKTVGIIAVVSALALILSATVYSFRRTEQSFTTPDTSYLEITSNRHSSPESGATVVSTLTTEGYEKKLENERLELWYRDEVAGIRILDKATGYLWGSIDGDKAESLNKKWSAFANSLCTLEYLDEKYNVTRISVSDSKINLKEKWGSDGAEFSVNLRKEGISFKFSLKLNEDSISFEIDDKSIEEEDVALLKSVYFVPFLGCSLEDKIDGYIFIPDGCGALMRFKEASEYIGGYSSKVYGLDMGIDQLTQMNDLVSTRPNDYLIDSSGVSAPVFGVVHGANQNAAMSVIESGEEFAEIKATPAGVTTDYNWVTAAFNYRQMYTHTVDKNSGGVYRPQAKANAINPKLTVYFLNGESASYSGMAVKYRGILEERKLLNNQKANEAKIPLGLYVIGSEIADGSLFDYTKTFTDLSNTNAFLDRLSNDNIDNISMIFDGWQKGGING